MNKTPYSYTNRQGKTRYFRAARTKKGGIRYYVTGDPAAKDLITEIPEGFEVYEKPYDGQIVFRKKVPVYVTLEEVGVVEQAMALSPVKDFLLIAEKDNIEIHISQFNSYHDDEYLSHEEAKELWGDNIHRWKKYDWIMTFELMDRSARSFRVIRKASVQYLAVPIDEGLDLKALAKKYCYHVGRESLLQFLIPGEDW